jgi:uncharacterized protein
MIVRLLIILAIILLVDVYGYYGLRKLFARKSLVRFRKRIFLAYWLMDFGFIIFSLIWIWFIRRSDWPDYIQYRNYFYITGAFLLIFLPKLVFLVFNFLHDIFRFFYWLFKAAPRRNKFKKTHSLNATFPLGVGFILSVFMFGWVLYGIIFGRYDFGVEHVEVRVENLPDSFDGFRIAHFSDTHLGSFHRTSPVVKGIRKIIEAEPDLLVFTGDMVNNEAVEAERFVDLFAGIPSPYGKFSILGNHDMGDYRRWYTIDEKSANLQQLKEFQNEMGFELLRNSHRFITIGEDSIMVAGVDNWGIPPFHGTGDLQAALGEYADYPYIILLSHDPSHWTHEVVPATNIMLTLSGHTHGFQVGIRTPWFNWSPVTVKYPLWNGLYQEQGQYLYVNRGFGFLGFPGRMGMPPEITVLTLKKAAMPAVEEDFNIEADYETQN